MERALERGDLLVRMNDRSVGELAVALRRFDEFSSKVENARVARLVHDVELFVFRVVLEERRAIDVRFRLHGIFVFEIETSDFEIRFHFVFDRILFLTRFEGNSREDFRRFAPLLFLFVDARKVLAKRCDLK